MLLFHMFCLLLAVATCSSVLVERLTGRGSTPENGTTNNTCEYKGVIYTTVYIDWPFYYSCVDLVNKLLGEVGFVKLRTEYYEENTTCTLLDVNGTEQWEITSHLRYMMTLTEIPYPGVFEVSDDSAIFQRIRMNLPAANYCSYQDVRLIREEYINNVTCENSENFPTTKRQLRKGIFHTMNCALDYGVTPVIYYHKTNMDDFTYEWTHNCETTLPNNSQITDDELLFTDADFGVHSGIYTCSVKYKGQTRFVTRHEICIKHSNAGKFTVQCPKNVEAKMGSEVNITCNVDFGPGPYDRIFVVSKWNKTTPNEGNNGFCLNTGVARYGDDFFETTNSTVNERAQCETVQISNINERCFLELPSPGEREAMKRLTRITLLIKKMENGDVGSYNLEFAVNRDDIFTAKIDLKIDYDEILVVNAKYIGIGIGVLVLLIILIIICVWRKTDIIWFMKKHFGAYEVANKKYMVYLSYHFSNEGMSKNSRELTSTLINSLNSFFDDFGGKIYDDHKDGNELQLQIENMEKVQKECHRIMIILNSEYVTDHWSLHKAYSALRNMIEGGAKVIFITLPGVESSFKKVKNESKTALKHAMKMNTTIEWTGNTPLSGTFCRQLKIALPKLQGNKNQRVKIEANGKIVIENTNAI